MTRGAEYTRRYRQRHPDRVLASNRAYRTANAEAERERRRAYVEANRDAVKGRHRAARLRAFGLTPADYDALLAAQGGLCAICRQPETFVGRSGTVHSLAVDHDHATGRVRGLLCVRCNQAIGQFGDAAELLAAASAYLAEKGGW